MNCPKCSVDNLPEAKFCRNCGTNLPLPVSQIKEDSSTIKSLLIIIGLDYLISAVMFIINKAVVPSMYAQSESTSNVNFIYECFGWTSDIVSLAALIYFLVNIKNNNVKTALGVFIVLRLIFMIGYRVFPLIGI